MNVRWNGGRARMRFGVAGVGSVLVAAMLGGATPPPEPATAEARTAAYFDRIADSPPRLRLFLQTMPKGGDLHNHAGGAIYAEDMLGWAAAEGLCLSVDPAGLAPAPCDAPGRVAPHVRPRAVVRARGRGVPLPPREHGRVAPRALDPEQQPRLVRRWLGLRGRAGQEAAAEKQREQEEAEERAAARRLHASPGWSSWRGVGSEAGGAICSGDQMK